MSRRFVITRTPIADRHPTVCAVFEDHQMLEVQCIPQDAPPQILNNIYVGRVSQVVKNIGAAFVEIESGKKCYLPLTEVKDPVYVKRISEKQPLSQGDEIVVQVIKEAIKTKDPQVTTNLSLAGVYSVVTSADKRLGISGKIDAQKREALRKLAQTVYDERFGVVVRTNAAEMIRTVQVEDKADAKVEDKVENKAEVEGNTQGSKQADGSAILTAEIMTLQKQMQEIISIAPYRKVYSTLYQAPPEYVRLLQNQPMDTLEEVVTDDVPVYEELAAFSKQYPSLHLTEKLTLYQDTRLDLHKLYSIQVQLERALQKKIWLKSGANLLIEPTEAMTVIDVNSSKNTKKKLPEEQHLQINLEAAEEIAKQLRLRNISGIIIIDFIDMKSAEDQNRLLSAIRSFVRTDPVKTEVVDLTKLGLMELTRKKMRRPLLEQIGIAKEKI